MYLYIYDQAHPEYTVKILIFSTNKKWQCIQIAWAKRS